MISVPAGHRRFRSICLRLLVVLIALTVVGCAGRKKSPPQARATPRYPTLPAKNLPPFLRGTVLERVDVMHTEPLPVSGYGLVANLNGTGDSRASNAVREYMVRIMERHGFGSRQLGFEHLPPERVLRDPSFAIVRVDGLIPPGARRGQQFDVQVSAFPGNDTTSLAHGQLYRSELKIDGANPRAPGAAMDQWALAQGDIFVNPAYALNETPGDSAAKSSLRVGVVIGGGVVKIDRPLYLKLRQPGHPMSREIDRRLDELLQDGAYAQAKDEGIVEVTVPARYKGDWEHFKGVMTHVYFNNSPQFVTSKARELAAEAIKPDALLLDISYCWEALGEAALPFITPLLMHQSPDVAYAAARAAAFIGEVSSQSVLIQMARTPDHPFQINAVQTLAKLPNSPEISGLLRTLLNSQQTLVRLEAYRALADAGDHAIFSRPINNKFMLDIIPTDAPPMIYATRRDVPRLAIFGRKPSIELPVTFTAMGGKFSISSNPGRNTVTIFYRGPRTRNPVKIESNPDIAEIAARLGGAGPPEERLLGFTYCDVVAIVQALVDQKKVTAQPSAHADRAPVAFVLQDLPIGQEEIFTAPPVREQQRPQADSPGTVSSAVDGNSNVEIRNPNR